MERSHMFDVEKSHEARSRLSHFMWRGVPLHILNEEESLISFGEESLFTFGVESNSSHLESLFILAVESRRNFTF
jgi:hypothetical protein